MVKEKSNKGLVIAIIIVIIVSASLIYLKKINISMSCAKEGEQFSKVYTDKYPGKCCVGLTEWESGMDTKIAIGNLCYETGLLAGAPVGTCINCGDGICGKDENACNCAKDCKNAENSKFKTTQEFCTAAYKQYCSMPIQEIIDSPVEPLCRICW